MQIISKRTATRDKSRRMTTSHIVRQKQPIKQGQSNFNNASSPSNTQGFSMNINRNFKKKNNPISRVLNSWWDRLLVATSTRNFAGQHEQYDSHKTKLDFIWNSIGCFTWGMVFPILTIVITQRCGVNEAGMFSMAFIISQLLMILGNFGMRTFQVSDTKEKYNFLDYCISRILTCIFMILFALIYFSFKGYQGQMYTVCVGMCLYKACDALSDVYEGRLQQIDKMYLAGASLTVRSILCFLSFMICVLITGNIGFSSLVMAAFGTASTLLFTIPLALFESPKSDKFTLGNLIDLIRTCWPVFIALILYALIDNMPKFVMEGQLGYDNQLYFNALYIPANTILIFVGLIYKPLLVRMSETWADKKQRNKFNLFVFIMFGVITAISITALLFMEIIGIPLMSIMYGIDFEQFRFIARIMMIAGGITGGIDFLYQVITVIRKQKLVLSVYVIVFFFSIIIPWLMINMFNLEGAVVAYALTMGILFVLMLREYLTELFIKNTLHEQETTK